MAKSTGILERITGKSPVDELQTKIAELTEAIAGAKATAAELRGDRAAHLQDWLAADKDKEAAKSGAAIVAADDNVAALEQKRADLLAQLHKATVVRAAEELDAEWAKARKLIKARAGKMAELQKAIAQVAELSADIAARSEEVWAALPEKAASRPTTYNIDLFARANVYLFALTQGRLGRAGVTPHLALKQGDLVSMDADAQKMLLLPLERKLS